MNQLMVYKRITQPKNRLSTLPLRGYNETEHPSSFIIKEVNEITNIYSIYNNDICLYVGCTSRDVNARLAEHKSALKHGKHTNKSLQKAYDACSGAVTYKLIDSIDTDNTLLKFFYESLYISLLKPKCNKCLIQQGNNKVVLQRCEPCVADRLIKSINKIC